MTHDLYKALGVGKAAKPDEIRKAYRKKAKKAHPDAGGSREEFALISLAADVLSDDERRANYDATGSVDEKPQDKSMSAVMQALDSVLNECQRRGIDPANVDIIADAKRTLQIQIEKMDENHANAQKQLDGARKLAKRFKSKKGKVNRLVPLFEGRICQLEHDMNNALRDRPSLVRAIEIVSDHTFEFVVQDQFGPGSTMNFARMMSMANLA